MKSSTAADDCERLQLSRQRGWPKAGGVMAARWLERDASDLDGRTGACNPQISARHRMVVGGTSMLIFMYIWCVGL